MSSGFSKRKREEIFNLYSGKCDVCGKEIHNDKENYLDGNYMNVDHIIPKSLGGKNNIENLRATCPKCNCIRNNKSSSRLKELMCKKIDILDGLEKDFIHLRYDLRKGMISIDELLEFKKYFIEKTEKILKELTVIEVNNKY